jgi:hypothetical protein
MKTTATNNQLNKELTRRETLNRDDNFIKSFNRIIKREVKNYDTPEQFFKDMQNGCISGMIGDFIYHADCKNFYIKNIDGLEDYKTDLEDNIGEPIANRHKLPHYTFVVWLCFEDYCNSIYSVLFED